MPQSTASSLSRSSLVSSAGGAVEGLRQGQDVVPSLRRIDHAALERQGDPAPDICKRLGQLIDQNIIMIGRRRCNAQPLGSPRYRRIIDWMEIDAMLGEQQVARALAFLGSPT